MTSCACSTSPRATLRRTADVFVGGSGPDGKIVCDDGCGTIAPGAAGASTSASRRTNAARYIRGGRSRGLRGVLAPATPSVSAATPSECRAVTAARLRRDSATSSWIDRAYSPRAAASESDGERDHRKPDTEVE